jgi:CheY-like chemotaxis protein
MSPPSGLSIFVLDDEALIRVMIADMVEAMGHRVVAEAGNVAQALTLAETAAFDLALLDVNIAGQTSADVAAVVARRGLPLVFVTGYGSTGLPEGFRDRPALQKPFDVEDLKRVIDVAFGC